MPSNKLHFQEIDWVMYLPSDESEGSSILEYKVACRDRPAIERQPGKRVSLRDAVGMPPIRDRYPHTVCLFRQSFGRSEEWRPQYVENRTIGDQQELISWIEKLRGKKERSTSQMQRQRPLSKPHSTGPLIATIAGWLIIALIFVVLYIYLQEITSFGEGLVSLLVYALLLPLLIVLFPIYASHDENTMLVWIIYGSILLGCGLIIWGGKQREKKGRK